MKNLKLLSLLAAALLVGGQSFAQESEDASAETKLKIEDAADKTNKVDGDMDEVITNKKMRAEAGSKSKFSFSTNVGYSGGSIEKPLAEDRPNITAGAGVTAKAALTADVSARYRMSATESLSTGIGVRWIAPLEHKPGPNPRTGRPYNGKTFDAANPYLSYGKVYKWSGIQSSLSAGPTLYTNSNLRDYGYLANFGISQNNVYDIGETGIGVGLLLSVDGTMFDKFDEASKANQSDYGMGAYPFLEYVINDTFNIRTISGVWVYEHSPLEARSMTFAKNKIYQSVGVGISVTRDIFLYPNIQFLPENMRADETNVAISTNINLF